MVTLVASSGIAESGRWVTLRHCDPIGIGPVALIPSLIPKAETMTALFYEFGIGEATVW